MPRAQFPRQPRIRRDGRRPPPVPPDPLQPIARVIVDAILVGLATWQTASPRASQRGQTRRRGTSEVFVEKIPIQQLARSHKRQMQMIVSRTLDRCLTVPTPESRALRMAFMRLLLDSEPLSAGGGHAAQPGPGPGELLTTAEAAALLEVSRPHVAMLADIGKLGEVRRTEGGHRRLRASAVHAYAGQQRGQRR